MNRNSFRRITKWLTPGLGFKRWVVVLNLGVAVIGITIAQLIVDLYRSQTLPEAFYMLTLRFLPPFEQLVVGLAIGITLLIISLRELNRSILSPLARAERGQLLDRVYDEMVNEQRRGKAIKLTALGGGTGLPSVLRGFRNDQRNLSTDNSVDITAIVTMADDGGSSGKLRKEFGVLPPGDVRNNLAALADDEDMMVKLFQYRFGVGGLEGHSFGNLFLTALANLTGSMEQAIIEAGHVLAIHGKVLPSTTQDTTLNAEIRLPNGKIIQVEGESNIPEAGGIIERVMIAPENVRAYPDAVRSILSADLIVTGPGSLYTSIIPNLLVGGIPEAIRASVAKARIYVCNIAMQHGETEGFTVAEHVLALEKHVGRGVFDVILANNNFPVENQGRTKYVQSIPKDHVLRQRYRIHEVDLTDSARPWRHDSAKLRTAIMAIYNGEVDPNK